jgi:hypothetical protein
MLTPGLVGALETSIRLIDEWLLASAIDLVGDREKNSSPPRHCSVTVANELG